MLRHFQFKIGKKDKKKASEFLSKKTNDPLYEIDEKSFVILGGFFTQDFESLPDFLLSIQELPNEINWQEQWEEFCPYIKNQRLELDLSCFGVNKTLFLTPGPGFGDLSHPTTSLCLKHMARVCKDRDVIDFGCGSGILSVAAYAFGAKKVISLEIDPDAIAHAKENLTLNGFRSEDVLSCMPNTDLKQPICIINMTFGEQKIALHDLCFFPKSADFLTSGILKEQKEAYLAWSKSKNLDLTVLDQEGKWLIFKGKFSSDYNS